MYLLCIYKLKTSLSVFIRQVACLILVSWRNLDLTRCHLNDNSWFCWTFSLGLFFFFFSSVRVPQLKYFGIASSRENNRVIQVLRVTYWMAVNWGSSKNTLLSWGHKSNLPFFSFFLFYFFIRRKRDLLSDVSFSDTGDHCRKQISWWFEKRTTWPDKRGLHSLTEQREQEETYKVAYSLRPLTDEHIWDRDPGSCPQSLLSWRVQSLPDFQNLDPRLGNSLRGFFFSRFLVCFHGRISKGAW